MPASCQRKETRVIFRIVLDAAAQNFHPVICGPHLRKQWPLHLAVPVPNEFHAARRVVEGNVLDLFEAAQQSLALLQGRRMRINLFDLPET